MINTFSFSYPWWYIFFCLICGIGFAFAMYFRDKKFADLSSWVSVGLGTLRTFSVFLITLLLLSPFIKTTKDEIKTPIVLIASDRSSSIPDGEKANTLSEVKVELEKLSNDLSTKFDVRHLSFGSEVEPEKKDSFSSKSTNISKLFQYISDNYSDQNLGAVIMATDGIYNEGNNPVYDENKFNAPLYSIALGDTTKKKDLYFQSVFHNNIAYLGDKFSVQVDISAFNCSGNTSKLSLESISSGQVRKIAEENISIGSKSFFTTKTFLIDASQSGVIRYRLSLSHIIDEFNTANNVKEFFVEVLDARQKILLLANAPHPDLGALKSLITENKNYEVEIGFAKDFTGNYSKYNLVIFHNLPSENADVTSVINQLNKNGIPRIFIVGMQTDLAKFNVNQDIIQIKGNSKNNEDIQGDVNAGFTLFTCSDNLKAKLKTFPPLVAPFGEYKLTGAANVFVYQNIKKIKTSYPLIAFSDINNIKSTIVCGEGIWKWRLFDHLQNKNYDLVYELINKTIQLTAIKSDKRKFRANTSKNIYKENENVLFDAQLYNDSYEMINSPDVNLILKDENNKEFYFTFSKTQNFYTLDADLFPHGSYSYTASTNYNGKILNTTGKFNVEAIQLEQFDLTARHGMLKGLSEKYNGTIVYPNNINSLKDLLLKNDTIKPILYHSSTTKPIIYYKLLFFIILLLLSFEWFFRRYLGNY